MKPDPMSDSVAKVKLASIDEFDLGGMHVCPARREVQVSGETRTLEPRVMQVLVALANARPSVVARDDLVAACWPGMAVSEDAINRCILALRRLCRDIDPAPFTIETVPRVGYALREMPSAAPTAGALDRLLPFRLKSYALPIVIVVGVILIAVLAIWRPWRSDTVSVAVIAATPNAEAQDLTRDVTAKLGMLPSISEGRAKLLDAAGGKHAQLRFSIDTSGQASDLETNLVLNNENGEVLWSKDFRQPRTSVSGLAQQLAYTAGKVLDCAIETRDRSDRLSRQDAKLYLAGCAGLADANESSIRDLDRVFEQVARGAPAFEPAWRKSLMAQATILDWYDRTDADKQHASEIVRAAAKLGSRLPELDVARSALLPSNAISARMKLAESAYNRAPADDAIAVYYSVLLTRAGRLYEGVAAARRAVRNDPLSPFNRETLILALATAGRTAEAEQELRQADALWPDSVALRETHYTLSLRFTDPHTAIRLRDSGQLMPSSAPWQGSFLAARADPTPANVERALRDARALYASDWRWISHISQTFGEFGRDDELFDILLKWNRPDSVDFVTDVIFRPPLHNFRRDPRFMQVAKHLGLLDYWRSSGRWPDFCSEPDLPYDCRREAAKL